MNWTVYRRSLRLQRRALIGWGIALALVVLISLATYPTIRDQAEELQQVLDQMPPAMKAFFGDLTDVTSGPGFIRGRLFSLMLPLLLLIYAVGSSADTTAGEEERGALDVQLAHASGRSSLLLQKAGAIATSIVLLILPCLALLLLGDPILGLGLDVGRALLTFAMLVLHTLAIGGIALMVGAATGRRAYAMSSAIGMAAAGYLLEGLGNLSPSIEPLQVLSTFHHFGGGSTLTTGSAWPGALVLIALVAACIAFAVLRFERRDIGTA